MKLQLKAVGVCTALFFLHGVFIFISFSHFFVWCDTNVSAEERKISWSLYQQLGVKQNKVENLIFVTNAGCLMLKLLRKSKAFHLSYAKFQFHSSGVENCITCVKNWLWNEIFVIENIVDLNVPRVMRQRIHWAIPENIHTPPPPWTTLNWVPKNFRISKNDNCSLCRIPEPADSKSWGIPEFHNFTKIWMVFLEFRLKFAKFWGNLWISSHTHWAFLTGFPMSSIGGVWIFSGIAHCCLWDFFFPTFLLTRGGHSLSETTTKPIHFLYWYCLIIPFHQNIFLPSIAYKRSFTNCFCYEYTDSWQKYLLHRCIWLYPWSLEARIYMKANRPHWARGITVFEDGAFQGVITVIKRFDLPRSDDLWSKCEQEILRPHTWRRAWTGQAQRLRACCTMEAKIVKYLVLSGYVDKILAEEFAVFKNKLSFLTDIFLSAQVKTIQKAVS